MGLSGSGKSSVRQFHSKIVTCDSIISQFINTATGYDDAIIGHSLEPCTLDIKLIKFRSPERNNIDFVFIDTPAFNFNTKTDREVLRSDANCLNTLFVLS